MKRKLFVAALILICLSTLAYGTVAFFTVDNTAHNIISSGVVDITVDEWADLDKTTPYPTDTITGIVPGMSVTKLVEITNSGDADAWVRIKVDKSFVATIDTDPTLIQLDLNTTDWTEQDGYYYYKEALQPGETTAPLFTTVSFDTTMGNSYKNVTAKVNIIAQAVQSKNNGTAPTAAAGWPA